MPSDETNDSGSLPIILLNILFFCVFIVALLISFHEHAWTLNAFTYLSYYIIFALVVGWAAALIALYRYQKPNVPLFFRRHWKGILASFLLTTIVFVSVPKYFRVLSDETNLLSVAKSITYYKTVQNITEGYGYYEMFWPMSTVGIEKRPFLFPFFTAMLHTFSGYRVENVFILNYFALWAMLFLIYLAVCSFLGEMMAFASLLLVMAQPFIALSATSGSFEVFNFVFILASFLALRGFLKDPNPKALMALIMTLIMLANIRYESALFLLVVMLVLGFRRYLKYSYFAQSPWYGMLPFLFLPLIWQRVLVISAPDPNLTHGWVNAFQLDNGRQNIVLFFKYIVDLSGHLGYAGVVNIAGMLAVVVWGIVGLFRIRSLSRNALTLSMCSLLSLLALFAIVIFYQGGINDHPLNGRFYLPIMVPLSMAPVCLLAYAFNAKQKFALPVLACSLIAFTFYHPVAMEDKLANDLMIIREYRYVDAFLKKNADSHTLIICGRPGEVIVSNYGAIAYSTANYYANLILQQFKNHLYNKIYAVQSISYRDNQPLADNVIDGRFKLKTLDELQMSGVYYFRISQVVP